MDLRWSCDGFAMDLRWICDGFAMDLWWTCDGFGNRSGAKRLPLELISGANKGLKPGGSDPPEF